MIKQETFTSQWLEQFRQQPQYKRINPPVFEKMSYALLLLEKLVQTEVKFIFKGGTSLVLLMEETDRFSVDIDIMTLNSKDDIEKALNDVVANSVFTDWELDERSNSDEKIPKAHYKVFFESEINANAEILLDVLFEENYYPNTVRVPIRCSWISAEEPWIEVEIPCVNSILGDKLTVFAPNTTGIRYGVGKHIEIVEQLHDVGKLFDGTTDISIVKASFDKVAFAQIKYRGLEITPSDICDDVIETALIIAREARQMNKGEDKVRMTEMQDGINGFQGFLMGGSFRLDDAVTASAKAAYLGAMIKMNDASLELYNGQDISDLDIENTQYNYLNRLRKINKEAFFYWHKALQVLGIDK